MAVYVRVETAVRTHPKFLKAGPAASWLWLCGVAYCQDAETDGFIPEETLPFLGVKNARQLVTHLEKAKLWDRVEGGWRVHDYLVHNRSAAEISALRSRRREGGKLGGRPKKNLPETSKVSGAKPSRETFPVVVSDAAAVVAAVEGGSGETDPPMDVWARELVTLMHPSGKCAAALVEPHLFKVLTDGQMGATPWAAWEALTERLEAHKRSHQWRVRGMVPRLDRWLKDGVYLQELPEHPPATLVNDKSVRALTSGAAFVAGGPHGSR